MDWLAWHEGYNDPTSPHARRLVVVQDHIRAFLDRCDAPSIRAVSLCSGSGADFLPVLAEHPAGRRTRARLIESHPELAERARATARELALEGVEVFTGDASTTDALVGAVPADLVLVCGVFGNISDDDVYRTVRALPQLCAEGATVVWTRHRHEPDLTPAIREWLGEVGFAEGSFDSPGVGDYAVGSHVLVGPARRLELGVRLFTFSRER